MTSLVDLQAPIDLEIVNALIAATPDTWNAAEMIVEREQLGEDESMKIVISSSEGRRDIVGPTDAIYAGLYKLSDLFRGYGKIWSRVSYAVSMTPEGAWRYKIKFEY